MNKQTLSKIKMKNRAFHRFLKTKDQHDDQMYGKYRNQSKNTCRKVVTDYLQPLSRGVKSNLIAFFRCAEIIKFQKCNPKLSRSWQDHK